LCTEERADCATQTTRCYGSDCSQRLAPTCTPPAAMRGKALVCAHPMCCIIMLGAVTSRAQSCTIEHEALSSVAGIGGLVSHLMIGWRTAQFWLAHARNHARPSTHLPQVPRRRTLPHIPGRASRQPPPVREGSWGGGRTRRACLSGGRPSERGLAAQAHSIQPLAVGQSRKEQPLAVLAVCQPQQHSRNSWLGRLAAPRSPEPHPQTGDLGRKQHVSTAVTTLRMGDSIWKCSGTLQCTTA
jgi:hypothetical protein